MSKARDIASATPAPSTVSATELGYLDGVSSAIQTQIDSKIGSASAINPTIVDAKGDLLVGSAADTVARLAVGTNDYVLTADSAATNGVKWAALPASGSTFVGAQVWQSVAVSLSNNTWTAMTWTNEEYDTDSFHDNSTNTSRITIPTGKGGKYLVQASMPLNSTNLSGYRSISVYKNGTILKGNGNEPYGTYPVIFMDAVLEVVAGDYLEIYLKQSSGGTFSTDPSQPSAWFAVSYLGA